jgi:nucleoside-diphosphate-sugar epimerase
VWGSPDVTRDVIYAADFGEAIARLVEAPHAGGRVFNVGSGHPTRVDEVVKTLLRITDNNGVKVVYRAGDPSSALRRVLNCQALFDELNWTPQTALEQGLRDTLDWWRANRTTWTR